LLLVLVIEIGPSMSNISNVAAAGASSDLFITIAIFSAYHRGRNQVFHRGESVSHA